MQLNKELSDYTPEERYAFFWHRIRNAIDEALSKTDTAMNRALAEQIAGIAERKTRITDLHDYANTLRSMRRTDRKSVV